MPPATQPRLDLRPLLEHAHCDGDLAALARMLTATQRHTVDAARRAVTRWAVDGVPLTAADRAAVDLGLHPMNIWGDEWLRAGACR